MYNLARKLARMGYTLRSGGADGSDTAFEEGANAMGGPKEIYLPWEGFNGRSSKLYNISEEAMSLAAAIHPAWDKLKQGAKKLHARNTYQVLGPHLNQPSRWLICWTEGGKEIGGTRTAIVLAKQHKIPIWNLGIQSNLDKIRNML